MFGPASPDRLRAFSGRGEDAGRGRSAERHAVTNTVSTQLLGPARHAERIEARGAADARTGRLGFVGAAASGPNGPVARTQVTKSIVRLGR